MKNLISLICLLSLSLASFPQTTVSGRILSQDDREPLISSTVSVLKAGTAELVTGTLTNEQGRFTVSNLPAGEYDFVFSNIGYESLRQRVLAGTLNKVLDLGNILLKLSKHGIG